MNGVFDTGYWNVGRIMGVPIRLHWSIPVGAFVFGHFRFVPGFWVGFFLLVLIHELGHAFLVKRRGLRNREIRVHGLGGVSIHERGSLYDQSIIAWGGVLAQLLVLYVPTKIVTSLVPIPPVAFLHELLSAFLYTNLILAAFNLIPIAPFDGANAWKFPRLWWARRRGSAGRRKPKAPQRRAGEPPPRRGDPQATAKEIARQALEDARRR